MLELAGQFEIPALRLRTPATLTTVNTEWLYNMSAAVHVTTGYVFHKIVFRIASATKTRGFYLNDTLSALDAVDYLHATTGAAVTRLAVEGSTVGIYPKAPDSLKVWFYRKPIEMDDPTDEPDGMTPEFSYRVLIPMVILKAFRVYPELVSEGDGDNSRSVVWWSERLRAGLVGDGAQIGWLDAIRKESPLAVRSPYLRFHYSQVTPSAPAQNRRG